MHPQSAVTTKFRLGLRLTGEVWKLCGVHPRISWYGIRLKLGAVRVISSFHEEKEREVRGVCE